MLYIVRLTRHGFSNNGEIVKYRVFDTLTESLLQLTPAQLHDIIYTCKIKVANAYLDQHEIKIHNWVNSIEIQSMDEATNKLIGIRDSERELKTAEKCNWILLAKEGKKYNLVSCYGIIDKINARQLKELTNNNRIANCSIEGNKFNSLDTYEIVSNKEFENIIAEKYKVFKAKALLLGYGDISFNYEIENEQVKIKRYTGSSSRIILPTFITAIMKNAFDNVNIEKLELNEGLRVIGKGAFVASNSRDLLKFVEIPSTVELIEHRAFAFNGSKYGGKIGLDEKSFKLRNKNTIRAGVGNMLYIIRLARQGFSEDGKILNYRVFDTLTESHMLLSPAQLHDILSSYKAEVANAYLYQNEVNYHYPKGLVASKGA